MDIIETNFTFKGTLTTRAKTTHGIIHHAAAKKATVEQIHASHLARGFLGIGYHFYITKDGKIYRGRPIWAVGGHTTGMNYCSVAVCFEGNFEEDEMPDAQINAGWELLDWLQKEYPGIIIGKHKDYNATACPGKNFPFEAITEPHVEAMDINEPSEWAEEASEWVKLLKISDGTRPHDTATREEEWTMLYRLAKLKGLV